MITRYKQLVIWNRTISCRPVYTKKKENKGKFLLEK